jgi:curved DNA-binding protein CbpA
LTWSGIDGKTYSTEAAGVDVSSSGVGIESSTELKPGSIVYVEARDGSLQGECEVVHCTGRGARFHIGLEFREHTEHEEEAEPEPEPMQASGEGDHYETLQISQKADVQTIHRVFRIMASRFHPDNPETGDLEQFLRMKEAYAVLSDPDRRKLYDATLAKDRDSGPRPIFALKDFVIGVEAEANRRLGVLSLLYVRRQTNQDHPGVSLLDLEREMGFPREYLNFTMWYLRSKDFVTLADNSDYALTANGADYVEKKAARNEIVGRLLNPAAPRVQPSSKTEKARQRSSRTTGRRLLMSQTPTWPKVG